MNKHVFISHSSEDKEIASEICSLLEEKGIECWIAPRDVPPGKDYGESIIEAIESTTATVLLLSEHSNQSRYVKNEIERGVSKGKPVFPVRIRQVEPSRALELFISSSQWIDAWAPPLEHKIEQLVEPLRSLIGKEPIPAPSAKKKVRHPYKPILPSRIFLIILLAALGIAIIILLWNGSGKKIDSTSGEEVKVTLELPNMGKIQQQGVSSDIRNALKLAYTSKRDDPEPSALVAVMVQKGGNPASPWSYVKNGDSLSSVDNYRILFQPEEPAFFYIFQIDSSGKMDWLFPKNSYSPFSSGENPAQSGAWNQIPGGNEAFHLDENLGIEHIYVIATQKRWLELENALEKAIKSIGTIQPIRIQFELKTRGVGGTRVVQTTWPQGMGDFPKEMSSLVKGSSGALVVERWFQHVAPETKP